MGGNTAGINNKEDFWSNLGYAMYRGTYSLFSGKDGNGLISGLNDPTTNSPHSGYVCVIGCGNDRTTPKFENYYNLSTNKESTLDSFYRSIYTEPKLFKCLYSTKKEIRNETFIINRNDFIYKWVFIKATSNNV